MKQEKTIYANLSVVMTGWAGIKEISERTKAVYTELLNRFPAVIPDEVLSLECAAEKAEKIAKNGCAVKVFRISGCGIMDALWYMSEEAGCGIEINMRAVPITQSMIEISEHLGIEPYHADAEGVLLILTDCAQKLIDDLRNDGVEANVIGYTTDRTGRHLHYKNRLGYLNRPGNNDKIREVRD